MSATVESWFQCYVNIVTKTTASGEFTKFHVSVNNDKKNNKL